MLGASNYTYAEAFPSQQLAHWIDAHLHTFAFFGGVSQLLVPDNLRTGVSRACYYEPQIHPTYAEMAAHYGVVVLPARPYAPRDKAKVESAVQYAQRRLLAPLRHLQFFSIGQINEALRPLLDDLNRAPFQKLPGSRRLLFEQLDQPALQPLPLDPYQLGHWRQAKVSIDYHLQVDWHYYSVPYLLVHQTVEVRLSVRMVEVFHQGRRVALHPRSDQRGGFTTEAGHRPKAHQKHLQWTPSRLIDWAEKLGPGCGQLVTTGAQTPSRAGLPRLPGHHAPGQRLRPHPTGGRLPARPGPGQLHLQNPRLPTQNQTRSIAPASDPQHTPATRP